MVDAANILPPATEVELDGKLAALEDSTGRQLVVATTPSLQGYEIEEYGYRLGRAWGIGREKADDGLILLVAPNERRVRIEVGYGLEGVVTDAVSSRILTTAVLPRFRGGDFPGGIVAGTDALIELLSLPEGEARARVRQAERRPAQSEGDGWPAILFAVIVLIVIAAAMRGGRSAFSRGRSSRSDWIVPAILWAASQRSSGGGSGWSGGGGGASWGGGGGFSGGGGSFGGGGASGSW